MKNNIVVFSLVFIVFVACNTSKKTFLAEDKTKLVSDTIRIANDAIEYEVTIIDGGFTSWCNSYAKPKSYYSQPYLEARNRIWVLEWNRRARLPMQFNPNLYEMSINYESNINYGYDVNYMIYNYLVYFQLTNKQELGGFVPRI